MPTSDVAGGTARSVNSFVFSDGFSESTRSAIGVFASWRQTWTSSRYAVTTPPPPTWFLPQTISSPISSGSSPLGNFSARVRPR